MNANKQNHLQKARQQKTSLTQAQVAKMVGITERYYQTLEYSKSEPRVTLARRLEIALGVPLKEIFPLPEEEI